MDYNSDEGIEDPDRIRRTLNFWLPQVQYFGNCMQLDWIEDKFKETVQEALRFRDNELLLEGYGAQGADLWRQWLEEVAEKHPFIRRFLSRLALYSKTTLLIKTLVFR